MTLRLPEPRLTQIYRLEIELAPPLDLGEVDAGHRRIVAQTGGTFTGPEINGKLLPGSSADWQIVLPDGTARGDIRYTLETDGGDLLYVQSRSVRSGDADVLARLAGDEEVDPSEYTFRASTQIETAAPALRWLNDGVFISVGGRQGARDLRDLLGWVKETLLMSNMKRFDASQGPRIVGPRDGKAVELGAFGARFLVWGEESGGGFSLVEHPIPPRPRSAAPSPLQGVDEYSFVLEGRMGALLGDDVVYAEVGDLAFKPSDQWHTFWNAGDTACRILEMISPAGFEHYFERLHGRSGVARGARRSLQPRGRHRSRRRVVRGARLALPTSYRRSGPERLGGHEQERPGLRGGRSRRYVGDRRPDPAPVGPPEFDPVGAVGCIEEQRGTNSTNPCRLSLDRCPFTPPVPAAVPSVPHKTQAFPS